MTRIVFVLLLFMIAGSCSRRTDRITVKLVPADTVYVPVPGHGHGKH